ncbi:hypothetical protein [Leucothrix pacifica]|uniref:Uncharacterized protein n=1 Tax=Leucothrix pacifica TaxID=1247513 RepID=A0A317CEN8_9GAMM|nr:hypothetical protein [Leucothrix pacifica]PWQ96867.1 hypothetical protein DKW60_11695 [Leucothrix pacifica]
MCNKDPLLDVANHDEKSDPKEQFLQALEEYGVKINDEIQLAAEHLFSGWLQQKRDQDFLDSGFDFSYNSIFNLFDYRKSSPSIGFSPFEISANIAKKYFPTSPYDLFETGLGKALGLEQHFNFFVLAVYGENFFFSQALFDEKALTSLEPSERRRILWRFFGLLLNKDCAFHMPFVIGFDSGIELKSLTSAALLNLLPGPPTENTHGLLQGIEFLKAWIRYDAEANRLTSHRLELLGEIQFLWKKLGEELTNAEQDLSPEVLKTAQRWLDETKRELFFLLYLYTNLAELSGEKTKFWANELDQFYWEYCEKNDDNTDSLSENEKTARRNDVLEQFCVQLTLQQVETWAKYAAYESAVSFLKHDAYFDPSTLLFYFGERWWDTNHFSIWKKGFEEGLSSLNSEERFYTLSNYLKLLKQVSYSKQSNSCLNGIDEALVCLGQRFTERDKDWQESYWNWCYSLLIDLHKDSNFPEKLMPEWTLLANGRLSGELRLPAIEKSIEVIFREFTGDLEFSRASQLKELLELIEYSEPTKNLRYTDKGIGLLRGKLSKLPVSEESVERDGHELLSDLLQKLDAVEPVKALRHRLILLRSSQAPFSDKSVYRGDESGISTLHVNWNSPFAALAHHFAEDWLRHSQFDDPEKREKWLSRYQYKRSEDQLLSYGEVEEWKRLMAFSQELTEFCLNRLRLRKGERTSEGKYTEEQVIERSSIWRKGYLRALTELGFDLGGKVHKTVNFTKQYDPDESVRTTAKECYRAVRRDKKTKRSIQGLKRGIIAAEWWLLVCQRRELGLEISTEGARRTRRNLLRNP